MAKKSLPDRPRNRVQNGTRKTTLTYYRSGEPSNVPVSPFEKNRPKVNRLRRITGGFVDLLLIAGAVICVFYSLVVKPQPSLTLDNSLYHPANSYLQAAVSELEHPKNRNKITFDERGMVEKLQEQFPEIADASVELPVFSQIPKMHITIASPSFTLNSNGAQYVVDSKGTAVARAAQLPGVKNLPNISDQTGFQIAAGKQVISAQGVAFIKSLLAQSKKANVPVSSLTLPPQAQELDLRTTDQPYFVKFYLGGDRLQQIGQFLATRKQLTQSNIHPSEYLDVRVNGKIFYK